MFEDIEINVKKHKRKTLSIYIERDGSVTVLAPENLSVEEIQKVIQTKEYQIYKYLAEWKEMNESKIARTLVNGQSYLYLGRNYRLEIINELSKPLMLKQGYFLLQEKGKLKAREYFINFYKEKGLNKIKEKIEKYQEWMGVSCNKIRIIDLKNRWGSCSNDGNLNFHWKCAMAPLDVLTYIVVHEMAHLKHKRHSQAFWNEVDKVLPNYQNQIEWLKQNGASLDI